MSGDVDHLQNAREREEVVAALNSHICKIAFLADPLEQSDAEALQFFNHANRSIVIAECVLRSALQLARELGSEAQERQNADLVRMAACAYARINIDHMADAGFEPQFFEDVMWIGMILNDARDANEVSSSMALATCIRNLEQSYYELTGRLPKRHQGTGAAAESDGDWDNAEHSEFRSKAADFVASHFGYSVDLFEGLLLAEVCEDAMTQGTSETEAAVAFIETICYRRAAQHEDYVGQSIVSDDDAKFVEDMSLKIILAINEGYLPSDNFLTATQLLLFSQGAPLDRLDAAAEMVDRLTEAMGFARKHRMHVDADVALGWFLQMAKARGILPE